MRNYWVVGVLVLGVLGGGTLYVMQRPTAEKSESAPEAVSQMPVPEPATEPVVETVVQEEKLEQPAIPKKDINPPTVKEAPVKKDTKPVQVPTVFRVAADVSTADFSIGEVLRGEPFTAVGTTSDVSGSISLDWTAPSKTVISPIKVNARLFKTESASRDSMIRRFILKSEESGNEYIVFETTSITGMPKTVTFGKPITLSLAGNLTIAGVTRPVTFKASATVASKNALSGTASATIKRSDYSIVVPSVPFVASVDEEVNLSISLNAKAE